MCMVVCACASLVAFAQDGSTSTQTSASLAARAEALRARVGPPSDSLSEDRADFLRRQLLASLERRQDVQRALRDIAHLAKAPTAPGAPPDSLLALDDLRREQQRLEDELAGGVRRRAILEQERESLARTLSEKVARQRSLTDARADAAELEVAALETELIESSTAELDLMLQLVDLQQDLAQHQRDANARRLVDSSHRDIPVTARDAATIEQRLRARGNDLRRAMTTAAASRERARMQLQDLGPDAPPLRVETMKERLANADIALELAREALGNLATEQAVWQVALRFYRDHDGTAIVDARNNGPMLLARLERRREFLQAMGDQVLARTGTLSTELSQAPNAPDAADRKDLRDVFEERLRMIERARYDEQRLSALIERIRTDLDARVGLATWPERLRLGWAVVRDALSRAWNFELFTVQQTIEVDGRKTQAPRGVTVGKLVKAPLLLIVGLFLVFKLTGWWERWLQRRRGMDEGRARLMRRWALAILGAACVLGSLAIAGIPLAAFAFIGGAVAIGIGFGMQSLFKNLISGVMVLVERPFRLGDVIEVGALRGTVVDIDLRTSVIRDNDGADTLIPNSTLMEENVKNVTHRTRVVPQSIEVVVEGVSDPREVGDAMRAAAERHGQVMDAPEPTVLLEAFAENGLRFALHYWIELVPGTDRRRIASDLRLMVLRAFDEVGIRLAPPPRHV
jgi:small-conductance mechanosensitive channel